MNFILSINKKKILFFIFSFIFIFFCIIFLNYLEIEKTNIKVKKLNNSSFDIIKPKFSINGNGQEIFITAKNGNFLDDEKILLEKDVNFKSKKFQIISENVIFDRKNLIASSNNASKFLSKNTSIISTGFDITESGNIINFRGKTTLQIK